MSESIKAYIDVVIVLAISWACVFAGLGIVIGIYFLVKGILA
jgi:hypothetical protein